MARKHPARDRNFDDLTPRFQRNIYNTLKGQLRLAVLRRDFFQHIAPGNLRILDAGAGQGQFALELARQGHRLTLIDISPRMLEDAQCTFAAATDVIAAPEFCCCSLQTLAKHFHEPFDGVLCHAVAEWLESPETLLAYLLPHIKKGGFLSIIFYNRHGLVFKNLLRTNFAKVSAGDVRGARGSLTPLNPLEPDQVRAWFSSAGLTMLCESGIRVFHDYILDDALRKQQGEALVEQELAFSRQMPFRDLGRYMHFLARV